MEERLAKWAKRTVIAVVVFIPAAVALTYFAFEVSSQPRFCGSCHIMTPYYDSWRTSSHNDIACVECHIPPGIASELRKKYEALSMIARYFTGTYSTNPWTEVDDQSCLRSGCHAKRVLLGRELYQGVLFDHQPHLTEMRRQKQLRCTSCHSQIVQGSHISVTPSTCFLCHFKNEPLNHGTGRCTLCHAVPEGRITTAGLSFDHGDVKRFGMECSACHDGVVKGNGEVPRERCFTCHNETARLQQYGKTEFLHRKHVTDHKVECMNCHIEIIHKIPAREEAVAAACRSCHTAQAGHSAVRDLYRGIGAKGVEPRPAAMYLTGIRCEACHSQPQDGHRAATDVSCMTCHGPKYLTIYRSWRAGLQHRLEGVTQELADAQAKRQDGAAAADGVDLSDTEANVGLVREARPIHNPPYALEILQKAHVELAAVLGTDASVRPWMEAPYESVCLACHFGIEYLSAPAFGAEFPHAPHVVQAGLRCQVCHGDMEAHGTLKLDDEGCNDCHAKISQPMVETTPEECLACHAKDIGKISQIVRFPHARHVDAGFDCGMCHTGVADVPHLDFARSGKALPKPGHEFCGTCHANDVPGEDGTLPDDANCMTCHESF